MNLFEILRQAGGGAGFSALASQFGLTEEQIAKAAQAFMPAFSAGLKRSTADPLGLAAFMRLLSFGGYPQAYQNPAWAFGAGRSQGDEALSFLFGSPEAARAIADQASAFTGLAREKLAAMLPALAAMTFGGLAQQAAAANPVLDAFMKQAQTTAAGRNAAKGPLDRLEEEEAQRDAADLAQAHSVMMKAGLASLQAGATAWQHGMGEMLKNVGGARPGDAGAPQAQPSSRDLFGELFEPGQRLSEAYGREVEALIARFNPETPGR